MKKPCPMKKLRMITILGSLFLLLGSFLQLFGQNYSKYLSAEADTYIGDLPEGDTGNYVFFPVLTCRADDWSLGSLEPNIAEQQCLKPVDRPGGGVPSRVTD